MKSIKLLIILAISVATISSCTTVYNEPFEEFQPSLESIVSGYDLWYVDYHRTIGRGDIQFVSQAFTLSFINGILYANNNIVDIGRTGNGLGIKVGNYNTFNGILETNHRRDGANDFEVIVLSNNEIEIYNNRLDLSYFLIGYNVRDFDYDKLFYENIEYFLQEYLAWEKVDRFGGVQNAFDDENYLEFTPENITTFRSSQDEFGLLIEDILWDYVGGYQIFDVTGFEDLKILALNYDNGDIEEFELSVIDDRNIRLFHLNSETTYDFTGRGFFPISKSENTVKTAKDLVRNNGRKRTKVQRETKVRRNLK